MANLSVGLSQELEQQFNVTMDPRARFSLRGFVIEVARYTDIIVKSGKAAHVEKELLKAEYALAEEHEKLAVKVEKELVEPEKTARTLAKASKDSRVLEEVKNLNDTKTGGIVSNQTPQEMFCSTLVDLLIAIAKYQDAKAVSRYVTSLDPLKVDYKELCPSYTEYLNAVVAFRENVSIEPIEGWRLLKRIHAAVHRASELWKSAMESGDLGEKLGTIAYLGPIRKILDSGRDELTDQQDVKEHFVRAHNAILKVLDDTSMSDKYRNYSNENVWAIALKEGGVVVVNRSKDFVEHLFTQKRDSTKMAKIFDVLWKSRSEIVAGKEKNDEADYVRDRNLMVASGLKTDNSLRMQIKYINGWIKKRGLPMSVDERGDGYQLRIALQKR